MISRRKLLQAAPLAALAASARAAKLTTVGVQLYTVRSILPQKPAEVLKAIEAAGYREIEATYGGFDKIFPPLGETSLKPMSMHLDNTMMNAGKEEDLAHAIDLVKKWGFSYAVFPYLPVPERGGLEKIRVLCDKLNRAGEKCQAAGLKFAYHNHAFEFEPMEGTTPFQVMMERLDKKYCGFEMDCFWVSVAGHDPVEMLKQLSGRVPLLHLKDKARGTPVMYKESVERTAFKEIGQGVIDWAAVLKAARPAGVEHYFVEQDQTPGDPIESLKTSMVYLSKLDY